MDLIPSYTGPIPGPPQHHAGRGVLGWKGLSYVLEEMPCRLDPRSTRRRGAARPGDRAPRQPLAFRCGLATDLEVHTDLFDGPGDTAPEERCRYRIRYGSERSRHRLGHRPQRFREFPGHRPQWKRAFPGYGSQRRQLILQPLPSRACAPLKATARLGLPLASRERILP